MYVSHVPWAKTVQPTTTCAIVANSAGMKPSITQKFETRMSSCNEALYLHGVSLLNDPRITWNMNMGRILRMGKSIVTGISNMQLQFVNQYCNCNFNGYAFLSVPPTITATTTSEIRYYRHSINLEVKLQHPVNPVPTRNDVQWFRSSSESQALVPVSDGNSNAYVLSVQFLDAVGIFTYTCTVMTAAGTTNANTQLTVYGE